jgi:AcrR family transcriptional regulator
LTTAAPGRRERTKAANRAAILEAALAVFGELGYDAASVRDVIRRTDLASGTFYNYFPDKEAILRALVEQTGDEARRRVRTARANARSAREFVEDAYRAYFEFMVEDPATSAFLRRNAGTIPAFFGDRVVPQGTDELAQDLRDAMARGELPDVDVDYCAHAMIAVGLELGTRMLDREPPDVEGATRFATELFLGGMARLAEKPR